MFNVYDAVFLWNVIQNLKMPRHTVLARYFPFLQPAKSVDSPIITFDYLPAAEKLAVFVSPLAEAQQVEERGFETESIRPAYVKMKTTLDLFRPWKRAAGESIGAQDYSPEMRRRMQAAQAVEYLVALIRNRMEWMACQTLHAARYTVVGDKYDPVVLDFKRHAGNTVDLTTMTNATWGTDHRNARPTRHFQQWAEQIVKEGGGGITELLLTNSAWLALTESPDFEKKMDQRHLSGIAMETGPNLMRGINYKGLYDGIPVYVHMDFYVDGAGNRQRYLPDGYAYAIGRDTMLGVQAHGPIYDENIPGGGSTTQEYYARSWVDKDPGVRTMLCQTAPIVYAQRPNAVLAAKVVDA